MIELSQSKTETSTKTILPPGSLFPDLPLQLPQPAGPLWQEEEHLPAEAQGGGAQLDGGGV